MSYPLEVAATRGGLDALSAAERVSRAHPRTPRVPGGAATRRSLHDRTAGAGPARRIPSSWCQAAVRWPGRSSSATACASSMRRRL